MTVKRTQVDGAALTWDDDGPTDAPGVALLLHGAGYDASTFAAVTDDLVGRGWRVLRPDSRGAGRSTDGAGRIAEGPPRLTADVLAILDDAGVEAPVVLGHSMGGWPALGVALAGRARALVLVATPAGIFPPEVLAFWESFEPLLLAGAPPEFVEAARALRSTAPGLDAVTALSCPVTFLCGADDPIYSPDVLRSAAAVIPGARVTVVDGGGHHLHSSHPQVVADAVAG